MVSGGRQALGFALAGVGSAGVALICGLPMWKVTAFISSNIVTAQVFWEGLWMNCVFQSTGQLQCKAYDSLLALPRDLQAARALVVVSIAVAVAAALLGVAGASCTNFLRRDATAKARVAIGSGVAFIAAGVLCLVPVCWTTSTLVTGFYNPLVSTGQKGELGAALYVGYMAGALLVLGGAILTSSCPRDPAPTPTPVPIRQFVWGSHVSYVHRPPDPRWSRRPR
ncbi:claudin-4-like [Anguilla anguilla]|uniref:claudin-4-like n=1 Tax=Anguilla anguilla TaxID=7936 RepID=UPI0015AE663D|nr:claudin-4-like [Anguilla anguilla]